jgi:hypothetical protein
MKSGYLSAAMLALASATAVGCGGAPDDDAARLPGASSAQAQAAIDVTAPAERLYFGVTNHLHVGGDVLAEMNLDAGARVEMEVATVDSSSLRFELWQVHQVDQGGKPWVELLNAFDVESGFVLTSLYAPSDGLYLVHFPAPASQRDVNLSMNCDLASGRCTSELQPGERCFEQSACSPGLACAPNDGACDPIWWGGQCVVPGDDTACEGLPASPACGCNDVTYGNECLAVASGSGMKTSGACPATPAPG